MEEATEAPVHVPGGQDAYELTQKETEFLAWVDTQRGFCPGAKTNIKKFLKREVPDVALLNMAEYGLFTQEARLRGIAYRRH